jgi:hypothetical protein
MLHQGFLDLCVPGGLGAAERRDARVELWQNTTEMLTASALDDADTRMMCMATTHWPWPLETADPWACQTVGEMWERLRPALGAEADAMAPALGPLRDAMPHFGVEKQKPGSGPGFPDGRATFALKARLPLGAEIREVTVNGEPAARDELTVWDDGRWRYLETTHRATPLALVVIEYG